MSVLGLSAIRLTIAAAVVIAAVVIPVITTSSAINSVSIPSVTPFPAAGGSGSTPPAARSSKPVSYLTAAGVSAGLVAVTKLVPGARLALVRLDARSLAASARLPNGTFREIVLAPTGTFQTPGASSGQRLVSLSEVRPRAVARIVTGMRRRFHVPARRIDYMVLSTPPGAPTRWIVFAKAPGHPGFSATLAGSDLTPLPQ